jgi:DNA polymerase
VDVFRAGQDSYKTFASIAFSKPYEEVTKAERTFAKPPVLGAGYGLSGRGLVFYAESMGIEMDEDEGHRLIALWRQTYHEVTHCWYRLEDAALSAVRVPGAWHGVRPVAFAQLSAFGTGWEYQYKERPAVSFMSDGTFLFCWLASGRYLSYYLPQVDENHEFTFTDREGNEKTIAKPSLSYMGIDQSATGQAWGRIPTRGAKLIENAVQALARDVLWNALEQVERDPGLEILGDVYDEILCLADEGDTTALERLIGYMTARPDWADGDLWLGADGYEGKRYRKD